MSVRVGIPRNEVDVDMTNNFAHRHDVDALRAERGHQRVRSLLNQRPERTRLFGRQLGNVLDWIGERMYEEAKTVPRSAPIQVWALLGNRNKATKSRLSGGFQSGSDGTRTRDLRRDRPAF